MVMGGVEVGWMFKKKRIEVECRKAEVRRLFRWKFYLELNAFEATLLDYQ